MLEAREISVYSCKPPLENICYGDIGSFYLVGGLNSLLQAAPCLGILQCFEVIILIEIFENSTIF